MTGDRYQGKPFLRLLDCYVLSAIGHLDAEQRDGLQRLEPKFREVFGGEGSWTDNVERQMEFPSSLPAEIAKVWEQGKLKAKGLGLQADPREFTEQFVDTNFPHNETGR